MDRLLAGKGTVMKTLSLILVVSIPFPAGNLAHSAQVDDVLPLDEDERLIDSAGLPGEGPMLLEFFRSRARTEVDPARMEDLLKRFPGSSFPERIAAAADLIALGPLAIPGLRRVVNDFEAADVRL